MFGRSRAEEMNWEAVLQSIDELVFQQTGKHLNNLQVAILKGVLNGEKYREIAQRYQCTKGHVKDEGYELWQVLSEVLGEDLHKSNFCATVERLGIANSDSSLPLTVLLRNSNASITLDFPLAFAPIKTVSGSMGNAAYRKIFQFFRISFFSISV